jgi:hypothetical protein
MAKKKQKKTKDWIKLVMYVILMIIATSLYAEYVVSRELNGFIQLGATIVMVGLIIWTLKKVVIHLTNILEIKLLN